MSDLDHVKPSLSIEAKAYSDANESTRGNANAAKAGRSKLFAAVDLIGFTSFTRAKAIADHDHELEVLEEQERDKHLASPWGTTRSLVNAAVSGGVLSLAFQIPRTGALMLVILLAFSGFILYMSMMMLFKCSLAYNVSSYTGTVRAAWGTKASRAVAVCLGLGQYGILCSYGRVLADTIPFVVQFNAWGCAESTAGCELPWYLSSAFLVAIIMVTFVIPISLRSDPDVIASISFTTGIHFFLFLILVVFGAAIYWPSNFSSKVFTQEEFDSPGSIFVNETLSTTPFPDTTPIAVFSYDTVVAIAIFAFAMEAHTTAMPLLHGTRAHKGEDEAGKISVVSKIVGGTMASVFLYYVWIALGCYMAFGDTVKDNCLNSFPDSSVFAMVIRCTYAFEIGTSIPIYVYSMRRDMTAAFLDVPGGQMEMDHIEAENKTRTVLVTLFLLITSTALGLLGSLQLILAFTGAIVTSLNTYVFPSLLFWHSKQEGWERKFALPLAFFGIVVSVIALYQEINRLFQ